MIWSVEIFLLVNLIIVIASILQMSTGVSSGVIIVPFLAMISYTLIPIPIIFASLSLTILMAYKWHQDIDLKSLLPISISMLVGIFIGAYLMLKINTNYIGIVFGVFILFSILISIKIKTFNLSIMMRYIGGLTAGFMGTMAAVGGQILALLFQNHSLKSIKSTLAFLYTIFSLLMLFVFYLFENISYEEIVSGFYMMPGFIVGYLIAPYFSRYLNPKYSKPIVLTMSTIGAFIVIISSIFKL
jgi:uncharacterized membrane protein YfcA